MKISLPTTGLIEIGGNESQWNLVQGEILQEIVTPAIIQIKKDRKVRVTLIVTDALFIKGSEKETFSLLNTPGNIHEAGMLRIFNFAINNTMKNYWILRGFIKGTTPVPILVQFFPTITLAVFTRLTNQEIPSVKFPDHMSN